MRTYLYEEGKGLAKDRSPEELVAYVGKDGAYFWIDLDNAAPDEIKRVGELFNFHPLAIEDAITVQQRPRVDIYGNALFIVLRDPELERLKKGLRALELDMFLGKNFIVTVHQEPLNCIETALSKLNSSPERLLGRGADFLAHTIIDILVDDHLKILNWLDGEISELEEQVFEKQDQKALLAIADLRKNILYLQRILGPQLELIRSLSAEWMPFIHKGLRIYFRDIYDNLARINDIIHNYREVVTTDMAIHQAVISNRLSRIIAILTILFTLTIPAGVIGTLYGMNIYLPGGIEAGSWTFLGTYTTFIIILLASAIPAGLMTWYFRRHGWF